MIFQIYCLFIYFYIIFHKLLELLELLLNYISNIIIQLFIYSWIIKVKVLCREQVEY